MRECSRRVPRGSASSWRKNAGGSRTCIQHLKERENICAFASFSQFYLAERAKTPFSGAGSCLGEAAARAFSDKLQRHLAGRLQAASNSRWGKGRGFLPFVWHAGHWLPGAGFKREVGVRGIFVQEDLLFGKQGLGWRPKICLCDPTI